MKFVTDCCKTEYILQDAYINPNTDEVASVFDTFICDNDECVNYGNATWCREVEDAPGADVGSSG